MLSIGMKCLSVLIVLVASPSAQALELDPAQAEARLDILAYDFHIITDRLLHGMWEILPYVFRYRTEDRAFRHLFYHYISDVLPPPWPVLSALSGSTGKNARPAALSPWWASAAGCWGPPSPPLCQRLTLETSSISRRHWNTAVDEIMSDWALSTSSNNASVSIWLSLNIHYRSSDW